MHVNNFVFSYEIYIKKFNVVRIGTKKKRKNKVELAVFYYYCLLINGEPQNYEAIIYSYG